MGTKDNNKFKINVSTENSFDSLTEEDGETSYISSSSTTQLNRSYPNEYVNMNKRINTNSKIDELQNRILDLEQKLQIADNEIENLLSENNTLSKQLHNYELKIKKITEVCKSTPKKKNLKKNKNRKNRSLSISQTETPKLHRCKIVQPETSIKISAANSPPDGATLNTTTRKKLCFLSTTNQYNLIQILEQNITNQDFEFCHYIQTQRGILALMEGIENKLRDFDKNDYCIILVGESDFTTSKDYIQLIYQIREKTRSLYHTNIIIAAPTYICGAMIYNYRIEMFNNLLNLDIQTHNYAYLVDSNRPLTYDMFSPYNGKLNKKGMQRIIHQIFNIISHDSSTSQTSNRNKITEENEVNDSTFFRE